MIREIKIPKTAAVPVKIQDEHGIHEREVSFPFAAFVTDSLLNHKRWQQDSKALRLSIEIEDRFDKAKPGQVIEVSDEAHQGLQESLDPSIVRTPDIARALMRAGYWEAIEEAPKKEGDAGDEAHEKKRSTKRKASASKSKRARK